MRYARRLLHRDPAGRYTAIVMTWGPGQGTAVHDHGGLWCVEGVVDGEIAVTQYRRAAGHRRLLPRHADRIAAGRHRLGRLPDSADRSSRARQRAAVARVGHAARLRRRSRRLQGVPAGDARRPLRRDHQDRCRSTSEPTSSTCNFRGSAARDRHRGAAGRRRRHADRSGPDVVPAGAREPACASAASRCATCARCC